MNLREAKRELIEHGYEIHQLNEGCYGGPSGPGCGLGSWSNVSYKTPHAPYRKDSELSDEELKARNELRAKKAKNKEIKAKIEPQIEKYAKKLEKNYDVYTSVAAKKGTIEVELGNNIELKMSKSTDNQTYFNFETLNGWAFRSDEVLECIERADEIKKLMADFKKFDLKV